jgi:photosystem II stability/assembly factor-like uncharacterized protein
MPLHLKRIVLFAMLCIGMRGLNAQKIQVLDSGTNSSLRGLSVVSDHIIWVSGSSGRVARSIDGGNSFKWMTVKGFEKTDFRDIEAFDQNTAIIMGIAEPAYMLRTTNGGESWTMVYENKTKGMFLDAMDFRNDREGMVVGDPIEGRFFLASTSDGGINWSDVPLLSRPQADTGEGCFASSGTNIRLLQDTSMVFITGGLHSNFFSNTKKSSLPILQGRESTGANSIACRDNRSFIVVGGDFSSKDSATANCLLTSDGGNTWQAPATPPHGYRSCVEWLGKNDWISAGLNGVDYSNDEGKVWQWISKQSYHVCRKAKKGTAVFFAGGGGKIGKLIAD